jgi:hypothetical protein
MPEHPGICLHLCEFTVTDVDARSSIGCIFDSEQASNKLLFLDLVGCSLQEITSQIAELTETPDLLGDQPNSKRRFVLQKDYKEYFSALVDRFASRRNDILLIPLVQALLTLIQNNIFYNIAKVTKLIKFYKLNWKDDVRILANTGAFKTYLLRTYLDNAEKKKDNYELSNLEHTTLEALMSLREGNPNLSNLTALPRHLKK